MEVEGKVKYLGWNLNRWRLTTSGRRSRGGSLRLAEVERTRRRVGLGMVEGGGFSAIKVLVNDTQGTFLQDPNRS